GSGDDGTSGVREPLKSPPAAGCASAARPSPHLRQQPVGLRVGSGPPSVDALRCLFAPKLLDPVTDECSVGDGLTLPNVSRYVLHVDLDQFIAAVELLRHPELRGKPVVVGGDGDPAKRGVVSTANYEAREYGVRSGMPLRTAHRRCPEAVFLPVDSQAYLPASARVMDTLRTFPAVVQVMGWDEAFMAVEH